TGLGIIDDAEGVLGVRRVFVIAGAGSLSHLDVWEIRDSHRLEIEPGNYLLRYTPVQSAARAPRRATTWRGSVGARKIFWRQGTVVEDDRRSSSSRFELLPGAGICSVSKGRQPFSARERRPQLLAIGLLQLRHISFVRRDDRQTHAAHLII